MSHKDDDVPFPKLSSWDRVKLRQVLENGRIIGMRTEHERYNFLARWRVWYLIEWPDLPEVRTWWPEEWLIVGMEET